MKKRTFCMYLAMFVSIILPLALMAQVPPPDLTPDPEVPIDGGLALLAIAGVGYGIKKLKEHKATATQKELC